MFVPWADLLDVREELLIEYDSERAELSEDAFDDVDLSDLCASFTNAATNVMWYRMRDADYYDDPDGGPWWAYAERIA